MRRNDDTDDSNEVSLLVVCFHLKEHLFYFC